MSKQSFLSNIKESSAIRRIVLVFLCFLSGFAFQYILSQTDITSIYDGVAYYGWNPVSILLFCVNSYANNRAQVIKKQLPIIDNCNYDLQTGFRQLN